VSSLEHPEYLWGLLLLPALWLVWRYGQYRRRLLLSRFVNEAHWPSLSGTVWERARRWRRRLYLVAVLLGVLALAGPRYGTELLDVERVGADLVIALDISGSMLAEDFKPNRLSEAKRAVQSLVAGLKGDRVGLVAFSGAAAIMCPLTSDYGALGLFLEMAVPGYIPQPGTNVGDALLLSSRLLEGESEGDRDRAVILITDGEDHAGDVESPLSELAKNDVKVYTVGIGSSEGTLIPEYDPSGAVRGYKKDRAGKLVQTHLDAGLLQRVAESTGGRFFQVDPSGTSAEQVLVEIGALQKGAYAERSMYRHKNRYAWPLGLALVALLTGSLMWERRGEGTIE
jgi:Ca-activated chloride channel family protein